jgi:NarL family two-component system response regulator LiaR
MSEARILMYLSSFVFCPSSTGLNIVKKIRVLIADDNAAVRHGLRAFLSLREEIEVVGEAANGLEAVEHTSRLLPDVVLMDLMMPQLDGIEATRRISSLNPSAQVIVLSGLNEEDKAFSATKAGAVSYLLKSVSPDDLVKAIQAAHCGET